MKIGNKEFKILQEIWVALGVILLSGIGSALWSLVQTGSIDLGDFLINSTRIPVSTLILLVIILVLFLNSYIKLRKGKIALEKSITLIKNNHKIEVEANEVVSENLKSEMQIIQQKIEQYESVEQNVLTVLEAKGHASIEEISNDVQSMNRNITGEQILNAISNLQSSPNQKIRGYTTGGFTKK